MRIRKRKVPLPLSLLSPIPLTDPNLFSRSPVILVQPEPNHGNNSQQPLDHLTCDPHRPIDDGSSSNNNSSRRRRNHDLLLLKEEQVEPHLLGCLGYDDNQRVDSVLKNNDASNKSITALGAAAADATSTHAPSPSSNLQERAMWCDEEKIIPLKKRKGSSEGKNTNVIDTPSKTIDTHLEHETKPKPINIKIVSIKDNNNANANDDNSTGVATIGKKGNKRGKTIMEGSRCSRVNGRGWRCCQPTLVGYSLCEHHLGKGRLRSMSNGRGRPSTISKKTALGTSSIEDCSPLMQLCEAAKKESDRMLGIGNSEKKKGGKRVKLGVVKARSLSSLLGQTDATSSKEGDSRVANNVLGREKEMDG